MEKSKKSSQITKNTQKSSKTTRMTLGKLKSKLLSTYYGNPLKDMKLICVTGAHGNTETAHFIHETLRAAGQPVAILASEKPFKVSTLHKFLSDAWKAGANYCVVTAPADSIQHEVFHGLPIHTVVVTNTDSPAKLNAILQSSPEYIILNRDDISYTQLEVFKGSKGDSTYGSDRFSHVQIVNSKLYKKGTEANLAIGANRFTTASFLTGEPVISYMAAAAAVAELLHITTDKISEGIANYDPTM